MQNKNVRFGENLWSLFPIAQGFNQAALLKLLQLIILKITYTRILFILIFSVLIRPFAQLGHNFEIPGLKTIFCT